MFSVTNPKVAGFSPRWASFRGFTILFDNPGQSFTADRAGLLLATDPSLTFYATLREQLVALDLDLLTNTYLFCPLPPPSHHVTACDGGNDANIRLMSNEERSLLATFLDDLPGSLAVPSDLVDIAANSPLVKQHWPLRFRFDRLVIWSHSALVAALVPDDQESIAKLAAFLDARRELNAEFQRRYNFAASEAYVPHVTLGYFANREGAQLALSQVAGWQERFAVALAERTLTFDRASLYGFTDLATFFKSASTTA